MQQVSSTPSTRADVIQLKESLDTKLQQRRAGQLGICPIRSELYAQCFGKWSCQRINVSVAWTINRDGHREDMLLLGRHAVITLLLSDFRRADQADGRQLC